MDGIKSEGAILNVYGDQWRTPLTGATGEHGKARLVSATYARGYYPMERVGGHEYYRVRRERLPVTLLQRHGTLGGEHHPDGWATWMVDDPVHWFGMGERVAQLQPGRILVAGLGLGLMLHHAAGRADLTTIEVRELDPDVIELVSPLLPVDPRVSVVQGDFYERLEELAGGPREAWPDAILWDLAVGNAEQTGGDMLYARAAVQTLLPGVPLHRFGLRGPDPAGILDSMSAVW